jgi:VWFA-related protein
MASAVLGGLLAAAAALPQAPRDSSTAGTLRATTHLVQVSVVARTKQGEPVSGLTQEDFTLLDVGRLEKIAFFRSEAAQPAPAKARLLPPGLYTNRLDLGGAGPASATVILFDALNTQFADQAYARQQILTFLRQLKSGDHVALYAMGRGPRVLQEFTQDPTALISTLAGYKGEPSASLSAPMYDPAMSGVDHFEAWLGEVTFSLYDYYGEDRAFRTVRALIAIAEHLERVPGRKNLLWVAGSFPVSIGGESMAAPRRMASDKRNAGPEVERAARALSRSGLAIYPVDARGLMVGQQYVGSMLKPELRNPDTAEFATMQMLAERTGGRAFFNNNDLAAALRRAVEDARLTYVLGYYPSHHDWKGRFRKIDLRVARPDVELLYRRGYFAQPDEPAEAWYRQRVLDAALWNPVDATGLRLTVAVTPASGGGRDLALQVVADDIAFRRNEGRWECSLDVWLVQLDGQERQLKTDAHTNNLRLEQPMYERVMQVKGLALAEHVDPQPQAQLLRVLVRDVASGALGSLTIPLKTPQRK